jgi:sulfhydrogenase subunit beta (sulfur reductase)
MLDGSLITGNTVAIPKSELDILLANLIQDGFRTIGPRLKEESIVYADVSSLTDLPRGITSEQAPASYRVKNSGRGYYFDFIPGAHSWKPYLFPPRITLFNARFEEKWEFSGQSEEPQQRFALLGVRACELAAISVQDKVFLRTDFYDPVYRQSREGLFIIAVNCLDPDSTCFCTSMKTGPRVKAGFDLCLTELDDVFLVEIGSELGRAYLAPLSYSLPSAFMQNTANQAIETAIKSIDRVLNCDGLSQLLQDSLEADRWDDVGKRCLSCANCTQVCPTCFCWDTTDTTSLSGRSTTRERLWDSCFNPNYSLVFGGNTRPNIRSRYRQWLTHKLGTWESQFGVSGCVGCGRCITWCPAKIDITVEAAALRQEAGK